MAAAVVAVVVDDLLQKLSQGMDLGPRWGVEAQLREMNSLLSSVQGAVPEAESMYPYSLELQEWVAKLKDAVYDAEDMLEELSMEEPLRLRDGKLRRLFRRVERCLFGRRMRRELGSIARRLQDLTDRLISIIRGIPAEVQEVPEANTIPFVGRDNEKEKLIGLLLDGGSEGDSAVVLYNNEDGSGKTALVREVMTESRVSEYFDVRIWVNAYPPLDVNRMAKEIIAGLREEEDEEEGEVLGEEQSLHLLARLLDDSKKYLFVLKNIYVPLSDSARWYRIRNLLVGGGVARGSKILFFRRRDSADALVLLRETASQGREGYDVIFHHPQFLEITGDIVGECNRDPWKIMAVGGYLSLQPPAPEVWSRLLDRLRHSPDSVFSLLLRGGYPYGDLTSPGVKRYNNLPPRIKQCFALCYLFPRGHPIDPHTLAELWLSLGFIHNNHDEDDSRPLEDIADHYLDVLLREELLRVKKSDIFGKVKWVTLPLDAREFADSIAGWECMAIDIYNSQDELVRQYARHQSIINHLGYTWNDFPQRKLRTFLHFEEGHTKLEKMYRHLIPKLNPNLNCLSVLDLHDVKADVLPKGVWKLKHLRYLDLSANSTLEKLPSAITGLLNLQTLKLSGCSSLTELPHDMNKLSALRHLYIDGCWKLSLIPRGLCYLKCLNLLTDFILPRDDSSKTADSAGLTDLCKLNDLRGSLKITNLTYHGDELREDGLEDLLYEKRSLDSLELQFMNLPTDRSLLEKIRPHFNLKGLRFHRYGGSQFPKWMTQLSIHLPNLVEIALIGCENCAYLPLFSHLCHLKKLTIQGLPDLELMESGTGESLTEDANGVQPFENLSSLCIKDCPKLKSLPTIPRLTKLTLVNVSEVIFRHPCQLPNLKTLRLENVECLDHLTEQWFRGLISLKELHIGSCHSLVSFLPGISLLGKLETLSIWNCKELDMSKDEQGNTAMEMQGLKSLKFLKIYKASKLEHLPEWLSHVATLKLLSIRSCPSLVVLPAWIVNLQSLELIHCPRLKTLPAGMLEFGSDHLWKMDIIGCPLLETGGTTPSRKL